MAFEIKQSSEREYSHMLTGTSDKKDPLDGAVDKYETIVKFLTEHPGAEIDDGGRHTCSLCACYWTGSGGCGACPVAQSTGKSYCYGSPYDGWVDYGDLDSAREMLDFLTGLEESG